MAKQKELSVNELVSIDFSLIDGSVHELEIYEPSQEVYRREKDENGKYQNIMKLKAIVLFLMYVFQNRNQEKWGIEFKLFIMRTNALFGLQVRKALLMQKRKLSS